MIKNQAIFKVETTIVLDDVDDAALNNSKVLHTDVLERLLFQIVFGGFVGEITLDEVFEIDEEEVK